MVNENKIRLVALLEERYTILTNDVLNTVSLECDFKIINFLPDIKIVKVLENGVHKQDGGKYLFEVEKSDIFQIPYTKNIKDLSVIVGENGSGKTTLINQILGLTGLTRNHIIYLIFESNNEFWVYPESPIKTISFPNRFECPYILKFSNANEFSNKAFSSDSNGIDVSNFNNVIMSERISSFNKNQKIVSFKEILNQIKFIEAFYNKIQDFVDYSKKEVIVQFQGKSVPFSYKNNELLYLNRIIGMESDTEKDEINFRLVEYFSVLINHVIRKSHLKRNRSNAYYENILNIHLALCNDRRKIKLQYQAIRQKFNYFIQPETVVGELKLYQLRNEDIEWIELWHLLFIFNVYFDYLKTKKNNFDYKYIQQMNDVLYKINDTLLKINEKEEYNNYSDWVFEEWKELLYTVRNLIDSLLYNENTQSRWNDFWRKNKGLCNNVAKAVSYTSYFELYQDGYSIKYKLIPEKVWNDLKQLKSGKEIESLQRFENFLYDLQDINTDFRTISSIVDCISKINIPEVLDSIQMRWKGLSSGELGLLRSFANLYSAKINLQGKTFPGVATTNYVLLFDEVDLGLHPEWQRRWVSTALPIIEKIFDDKHLQVIITTHSPIFLSDIYKENIIFLATENNEELNEKTIEKTFGQNIYTLFKNSFFLNDVMGEYVFNTIKDTIEYLSFKINSNSSYNRSASLYNNSDEIINEKTAKKVIDSIGEPIIANQLKELFYKAFPNKNDEISEIQNKINQLQKKLEQLEEEHSQ